MAQITAIFTDLGDTFRIIRKDEAYKTAARTKIAELLGVTDEDPNAFYERVIEPPYDVYREWALKFYCEAPCQLL